MHVWPIFVQLNVCGEFCAIFWTYLLKMCKKPIQIDGLDSCLGEEDSKQNKIWVIIQALFFLSKRARRLGFISFSVLFYCVTNSFNTYFKNSH